MSLLIADLTTEQKEHISTTLLGSGHTVEFKEDKLHISHKFYKAVGQRVITSVGDYVNYVVEFVGEIQTGEARLS